MGAVVIDVVVAGQRRAGPGGEGADRIGQERTVRDHARLVGQAGRDRLVVVFGIVVGAGDPLERTIAARGQVHFVAEPVLDFLIREAVARIDRSQRAKGARNRNAGRDRRRGRDERQLERGDRRLLDRRRAVQVVVIVRAAGDVFHVEVVEVVDPLGSKDRRAGQLDRQARVDGLIGREGDRVRRAVLQEARQGDVGAVDDDVRRVGAIGEGHRRIGVARAGAAAFVVPLDARQLHPAFELVIEVELQLTLIEVSVDDVAFIGLTGDVVLEPALGLLFPVGPDAELDARDHGRAGCGRLEDRVAVVLHLAPDFGVEVLGRAL